MTPSSITVSVTPVSMEAPARAAWKAITVTVHLVSHHSSCKSQVFRLVLEQCLSDLAMIQAILENIKIHYQNCLLWGMFVTHSVCITLVGLNLCKKDM